MFRKTPSKNKTLFTEIRIEFSTLHEKGKEHLSKILDKYPEQCFSGMVFSLIVSALLTFIILPFEGSQQPEADQLMEEAKVLGSGVADEVSALFQIGNEAKRIGQLKHKVERIIAKDKIDFQDSIFLENAISELEKYQKLNSKDHED
ncbi:hypothetical protein [uncultured Cyclobacterium sp.]|uniref:hypothetical protein n=1 Tax=uncultured Cyclobacterium sp. TaxID=453820 RepID=UPI0030ED7F08|tara:strand:- start:2492 stop:2932 length:441 start_codon:yes stop_codon:yes gene_type:complete